MAKQTTHMIYFCYGASASCSPWASHSPCSACRAQVLAEFWKGTSVLDQAQRRGSLWTVPPSHSSPAGWSLCLCSASPWLLYLGQAHVPLHWPPQFSLQWGSPGSICTYWVGRPRVPTFWRNSLWVCFPYSFRKQRRGQNNPQYRKCSTGHGYCCIFLACHLLRRTWRVNSKTVKQSHPGCVRKMSFSVSWHQCMGNSGDGLCWAQWCLERRWEGFF